MTPFDSAIFALSGLLLFTSCSKKEEPAAASKDGLKDAMKGVAQAEEGFKRMRERSESLQQKIDEQGKLLDATIGKHVSLFTNRVVADEKAISALPDEKQEALRSKLADLKQQVATMEAAFREYRDAATGKLEESKRKLGESADKANAALAQLEADIRSASAP